MTKQNLSVFEACPCAGATLDKLLQPAVLAILVNESMHGYELALRIGKIPNFLDCPPDMSGIYRILKNLEARGMVVAEWDTSETSRTKRLYSITDDGRHCLSQWNATLRTYRKSVDALLEMTQKALLVCQR